ncbi:hypothetical protein V8E36_005271 [Tilletia maclaganii]
MECAFLAVMEAAGGTARRRCSATGCAFPGCKVSITASTSIYTTTTTRNGQTQRIRVGEGSKDSRRWIDAEECTADNVSLLCLLASTGLSSGAHRGQRDGAPRPRTLKGCASNMLRGTSTLSTLSARARCEVRSAPQEDEYTTVHQGVVDPFKATYLKSLFRPTAYNKGQTLWQQHQHLTLDHDALVLVLTLISNLILTDIDILIGHQPIQWSTRSIPSTSSTSTSPMSTSTSTSPSPRSVMVKTKSAFTLIHTQAPGPDYDQGLLQDDGTQVVEGPYHSTRRMRSRPSNGGTTTRHPPRPVTLIPDFDLQDASLEHDSSSILSTDIRASPSTSIIQHFTNSQQVFAFVDVGARGSGSLRHMEGPDVKEAEIAGNHKGTAGGAARCGSAD